MSPDSVVSDLTHESTWMDLDLESMGDSLALGTIEVRPLSGFVKTGLVTWSKKVHGSCVHRLNLKPVSTEDSLMLGRYLSVSPCGWLAIGLA